MQVMASLSYSAVLLFCSTLLVSGRAQKISLLRIAPWQYEAVEGSHDEAIATSVLKNDINETGWAVLEVHGNANAAATTDDEMAYAAGYAEGLQTAELIYMSYMNSFGNKLYCGQQSQYCDRLRDFLDKNQQYMAQEIARNPDSQFWHQVYLYQQQLKGLRDGYSNNTEVPPLPDESFLFIQIFQDLDDLEQLLKAKQSDRNPLFSSRGVGTGHCSALIKVLPGNTDLYTSHDTWGDYHSMLRVIKLYDLPYHTAQSVDSTPVAAQRVAMSSYPGKLQSEDDYHLTSAGLVAMETTNEYSNLDLLNNITPECVFEPIRVMVANRLARNGRDWVQIFAMDNSGTYNNQWMVVDYKLFTAGKDLPSADLLWVLEQLPGTIVFGDQTRVLRDTTYWASYNIPFYSTIFNVSGNADEELKHGDTFSHDKAPRAKIFARNHSNVHDMDSMIALMRYNNYQHDPLSACDCDPPYSAENAIAARSDLNPVNGTYPIDFLGHRCHGATDNKVTSSKMMARLSFMATCGPTHQQQPVFQWTDAGFGATPMGHPNRFDFNPVLVNWH